MPTISELSLQRAFTKSLNAESSRFFDESNSLWMASCIVSTSRSESRGCLLGAAVAPGTDCVPLSDADRMFGGPPLIPLGTFAPPPKIPFFVEPCPPPVFAIIARTPSAFCSASSTAYQLSPRLPARKREQPRSTFKHAMLRSDSPGGCVGPPRPRPSENAAVAERGVCEGGCSTHASRLDTTRMGTENFDKELKKASRGVVRPSMPETFVIAW